MIEPAKEFKSSVFGLLYDDDTSDVFVELIVEDDVLSRAIKDCVVCFEAGPFTCFASLECLDKEFISIDFETIEFVEDISDGHTYEVMRLSNPKLYADQTADQLLSAYVGMTCYESGNLDEVIAATGFYDELVGLNEKINDYLRNRYANNVDFRREYDFYFADRLQSGHFSESSIRRGYLDNLPMFAANVCDMFHPEAVRWARRVVERTDISRLLEEKFGGTAEEYLARECDCVRDDANEPRCVCE